MILDALIFCCEHKLWQGAFKTFSSVFWRRSANSLSKLINEGWGHFAMRLLWSALRCFYTAKCFAGIVFARLQHVVKIDSLWFVYKKHKPDTLSGIDWMYTVLLPAGGYLWLTFWAKYRAFLQLNKKPGWGFTEFSINVWTVFVISHEGYVCLCFWSIFPHCFEVERSHVSMDHLELSNIWLNIW